MSIRARFQLNRGDFSFTVDLDLPGRGVTALFGASGSGKTTFLRLIAGLERTPGFLAVNGEIWQDDEPGQRGLYLPVHRRALGFVFQEPSLFPHLSARRNLEYGLKRVPVAARRIDPAQIIQLLGIESLLERRPAQLSGGECQRVAIARALLTSPRILLMDEPLAALDLARKQEILPYLERLHEQLDIPVLYVSHAPDEVARLADHLVVLDRGRVVASGPLGATLARLDLPIHLGEDIGVVLTGTLTERDTAWHLVRIQCAGASFWVRDGGQALAHPVRVRILARDVSIALSRQDDSSILNLLPAQVVELAPDTHSALTLVRLAVGDSPLIARLTQRSAIYLGLQPGKNVWAQVKAVAII